VAAGQTLTSGTVTYWPMSAPDQVHTLATGVTGGPGATIATLDTTVLANGPWVIKLDATNNQGQSQVSLASVTVSGEYKPGRAHPGGEQDLDTVWRGSLGEAVGERVVGLGIGSHEELPLSAATSDHVANAQEGPPAEETRGPSRSGLPSVVRNHLGGDWGKERLWVEVAAF
jgi:hypothetical protein